MRRETAKTSPDRIALSEPTVTPHKRKIRVTFFTGWGILIVAAGVIALIHPNLTLPGKKENVTIANQRVLIETHRVISIPRAASATEVVLGIGLIIFGSIDLPRRPRY